MYHARFKGTHYEAGYKWGKLLLEHGKTLEHCPTFMPDDEMRKFAQLCKAEYRKFYPELLDEIQGIADGQHLSVSILETILFSMYCMQFNNHCTCFAFSNINEIIFARNSDFLVSIEKLYMNCIYALSGAYAFNGNTTAYVEMEDGVNEHGLAAGLCFVYPKVKKPGFNAGMLIRYILEKCKTTSEAITSLQHLPIASSQTITLADRNGEIAVIECNAEKLIVRRPELNNNFVAAANCFVTPEMSPYRNTEIDDWRADERYHTAQTALTDHTSKLSIEFAKDVLSGRYGFMCQYDRKANADTVWSVIYDTKRKQIWRAEGNPSRKAFKEDARMKLW
jgi:predicted choloylglycine hydrolase